MKVSIVSLGCPKNQVDADIFCAALIDDGFTIESDPAAADFIIINTCGFIDSAKEEAIATILEAAALKEENPALKLVVTGCLAERYKQQLADELPEVDAVVGIGCNADLPHLLRQLAEEDAAVPAVCTAPKIHLPLEGGRVIGTPWHYAYLKIAEGCSNACSYCAIPSIRGGMRSRSIDSCVDEARWLAEQGVKELILVAQDVSAYGQDQGEARLPELLRRLEKIDGIVWIRLLYLYPERITKALLQTMQQSDKLLPYFDLPIQHINDDILRSMGRQGDSATIRRVIQNIRTALPQATLRTTLIAGYPGETEAQFEELCLFIEETQFDRLGCFAYSAEEGTRAAAMAGQLPEEIKQDRVDIIMSTQTDIMAAKQLALVGTTQMVLCDGYDDFYEKVIGRTRRDAPEIDTYVLLEPKIDLAQGELAEVSITDTDGIDLYGTLNR